MNRCKTCKHWEPYGEHDYGVLRGSGSCSAARQLWDVTEQMPPDYDELHLLPGHAGLLCAVNDGSQYAAYLVTMPEFGCVMHEPR